MSEEKNYRSGNYEFVDISSSSGKPRKADFQDIDFSKLPEKYGNGIFKNLGNIIKSIAFIICFCIIAISFIGAFFLFTFDKFFMAIAVGLMIFGTVIALITMFLIYSLGHIINQNNEILSRLKHLMK